VVRRAGEAVGPFYRRREAVRERRYFSGELHSGELGELREAATGDATARPGQLVQGLGRG
jgi:hypothetical protein